MWDPHQSRFEDAEVLHTPKRSNIWEQADSAENLTRAVTESVSTTSITTDGYSQTEWDWDPATFYWKVLSDNNGLLQALLFERRRIHIPRGERISSGNRFTKRWKRLHSESSLITWEGETVNAYNSRGRWRRWSEDSHGLIKWLELGVLNSLGLTVCNITNYET